MESRICIQLGDSPANDIVGRILDRKRPLKTSCFQGLVVWLLGHATTDPCDQRKSTTFKCGLPSCSSLSGRTTKQ
jgi:hypothetical protein